MDISTHTINQETCIDRDSSTSTPKDGNLNKKKSLFLSPLPNLRVPNVVKRYISKNEHEVSLKQREKYLNDIKSIDLSKYSFANE
jgi:hypothetical protein